MRGRGRRGRVRACSSASAATSRPGAGAARTAGRCASPTTTRRPRPRARRSRRTPAAWRPRAPPCDAGATASARMHHILDPCDAARPRGQPGARQRRRRELRGRQHRRAPPRSIRAASGAAWLGALGLPARLVATGRRRVTRRRLAAPTPTAGACAARDRAGRAPLVPDARDRRGRADAADRLALCSASSTSALQHARLAALRDRRRCTGTCRCWRSCFFAVHILTSVLDSFAAIPLIDAVVPFTGSYRPLWLGLGALAFDLMIAVVITSLLPGPVGYARLARRPLARLRVLAGRAAARARHRQRRQAGWLLVLGVCAARRAARRCPAAS